MDINTLSKKDLILITEILKEDGFGNKVEPSVDTMKKEIMDFIEMTNHHGRMVPEHVITMDRLTKLIHRR